MRSNIAFGIQNLESGITNLGIENKGESNLESGIKNLGIENQGESNLESEADRREL
jgi:hypothetical protein